MCRTASSGTIGIPAAGLGHDALAAGDHDDAGEQSAAGQARHRVFQLARNDGIVDPGRQRRFDGYGRHHAAAIEFTGFVRHQDDFKPRTAFATACRQRDRQWIGLGYRHRVEAAVFGAQLEHVGSTRGRRHASTATAGELRIKPGCHARTVGLVAQRHPVTHQAGRRRVRQRRGLVDRGLCADGAGGHAQGQRDRGKHAWKGMIWRHGKRIPGRMGALGMQARARGSCGFAREDTLPVSGEEGADPHRHANGHKGSGF